MTEWSEEVCGWGEGGSAWDLGSLRRAEASGGAVR